MQHYRNDPYESEPLDSQNYYESSPRQPMPPSHGYSQAPAQSYSPAHSPYYDSPSRPNHPGAHPDSAFNRMQGGHDDHSNRSGSPYTGSAGYDSPRRPSPPYQTDNGHYRDGGGGGGGGGHMGGVDAMHSTGLPPPPSRSQQPHHDPYTAQGGYGYDPAYDNGAHHGPSQSSLAGLAAAAGPGGSGSGSHFNGSDPYIDNPYPGYSSRNGGNLGVVNPNEIADDGDDGLSYGRSQRNSMLSLPHSDRGRRGAATAAAAVGGGAAAGGLLARGGSHDAVPEKSSDWLEKNEKKSKKWKWVIIIIVFVVIIGAIVGGVVGGMMRGGKGGGGSSSGSGSGTGGAGQTAAEDEKENGDLGKNSAEIKDLLDNPDLHRVFPGIDYTPLNSQYPDCMHHPPSQNNVTRDVAVLGQLTNKIRLYGTDCNQTQMLLHAIDRLELDDVKVWLGVWLDKNETTNDRQLQQMWDILDEYGEDPFEGIIIANEILFREEMSIASLSKILADTRTELDDKKINLPVATSDLGDDWTAELAKDSEYIMANIHPFFAGVTAEEAASWTWSFWDSHNSQFWKTDNKKNIISETGWPTAGGKNCGGVATCTEGSVAGIDELNTFMDNWVCQALKNGTQYFWFEAFDEPWKERFNEKGKAWEDKWGLLTVNRKLKDGVKIPDCDGKTIKDQKDYI